VRIFLLLLTACSSYAQYKAITDDLYIPREVFKYPYNEVWRAVVSAMNDYKIDSQNEESGIIATDWENNTQETNFTDSFDERDGIKAARFKLTVSVSRAFQGDREVSEVTVHKRQLIEQDFLQGWIEVIPDYITEKVLLYRIGRNLRIDHALQELQKLQQEEVPLEF
jgi:uncharacterized lipoprotein